MTGDRDTLQLVGEGVRVLMTGKGITETVTYDREAVEEKYGVAPEKLPDVAGLKGDASDNIPGVPGIGEKGASALIKEYGSLEALFENLDGITGAKRKSSLEENREIAFLSRELSRLITDVPMDLDPASVEFGSWNRQDVLDYLSALEFKTLARRFLELFGEGLPLEEESHGGEIAYALADPKSEPDLQAFVAEALDTRAVGVASSCFGAGYCDMELDMLALATGGTALVLRPLDPPRAWQTAEKILCSDTVEKWFHDAKGTLEALDKKGASVRNVAFDTAIAAYLENPSLGTYLLWDLWERNLGGSISMEGQLEVDDDQPTLLADRAEGAGTRIAFEAARVFHLKRVLQQKLRSLGMLPLFEHIEMPVMGVLKEMEMEGVAVDRAVLEALSKDADAVLNSLEKDIHALAGREFNIASPRQLAQVLFEDLGLTPVKKTKTGYSTDSSVLEALRGEHPIAGKVVEYREYSKLKSTYFDVLPALICPASGRVHGYFQPDVHRHRAHLVEQPEPPEHPGTHRGGAQDSRRIRGRQGNVEAGGGRLLSDRAARARPHVL